MPEFLIDTAIEYDLDVAQIMVPANMPDAYYDNLRGKCEEHDIELDVGATMSLFELTGDKAAKAGRTDRHGSCHEKAQRDDHAQRLRQIVLRYLRFNLAWPYEQHMQFWWTTSGSGKDSGAGGHLSGDLRTIATSRAPSMPRSSKRSALRLSDAHWTPPTVSHVYCDPIDEVRALAPYTITTHIKDMVVRRDKGWRIPFYPSGCALGEGHAEAEKAVRIIAENSPHAKGLH
jgi:hypothetical protein